MPHPSSLDRPFAMFSRGRYNVPMRILRISALAIGSLILGFFLIGGAALIARWVQVKTFPQPPYAPHLPQKLAYLDSLAGLDLSAAPNVVLIFFDDLGYGDLSINGNTLIKTPRIDSLAGEGIQLTNFYAPTSVCTGNSRTWLAPSESFHNSTKVSLNWSGVLPCHSKVPG